MKMLLRRLAATAAMTLLLAAGAAQAQLPPASGIVINQTPVQGGSAGQCLFINNSQISSQACGGAGTVTSVSVTTANGVSGSVATATTTPAISLTLGAITPSSVAIGAGSAITSSGPGGALASGAYAVAAPCSAFGTAAGTCAQGGVITAGGPTGSATVAPIITYNAAGQLTTVTSATITPAVGSVTGLGTGVGTALAINVGTAGAFITNGGALGTPSSGTVTNLTGTASININGTVGATTRGTGAFTTLSATSPPTIPGFIQTGTATYSAGTMGYFDANFGALFRPLSAGASKAFQFENSAGTVLWTDTEAGAFVISGSLNVSTMAQTSAAQSGTVCYNSGTGLLTYDATLGCLASTMAAKDAWKSIEPEQALQVVLRMQPGSFTYKKNMGLPEGEQIGFNAEQMATIDERLVSRDAEGKLRGVRYQQDSTLYAGAIQALKADNDDLRACYASWKCRIFGWR